MEIKESNHNKNQCRQNFQKKMHFIFRRNMILSRNIFQLRSIVDKNHELGKVLRCSAFSSLILGQL